jgi:Ferritin-like
MRSLLQASEPAPARATDRRRVATGARPSSTSGKIAVPFSKKDPLRWRAHRIDQRRAAGIKLLTCELVPGLGAARRCRGTDGCHRPPRPVRLPYSTRQSGAAAPSRRCHRARVDDSVSLRGLRFLGTDSDLAPRYRDIIGVAVEEMAHLMTVQNLLKLLGAEPEFARQDFGPPDSDEHRLFPFCSWNRSRTSRWRMRIPGENREENLRNL